MTAGRGSDRCSTSCSRFVALTLVFIASIGSQGCALRYWLGARLFYDKAPTPPSVELNVGYDVTAPDDPPFLIVSATGEHGGLQRQSRLFHERLQETAVPSTFVRVNGSSHERIILELSRDDKTAGPAVLAFVRDTPCPRPPATPTSRSQDHEIDQPITRSPDR